MAVIARCPHCDTSFRVTPKQMKTKSGKVRCGTCKGVFSVLDHLVEDSADSVAPKLDLQWPDAINRALISQATAGIADPEQAAEPAPAANTPKVDSAAPVQTREETPAAVRASSDSGGTTGATSATAAAESSAVAQPEWPNPPDVSTKGLPPEVLAIDKPDRSELGQSARELRSARGYSRWAEAPLSSGNITLDPPPRTLSPMARTMWPVIGVAAVFALLLQGAYWWRDSLAVRQPALRPLLEAICVQFHCRIELPHDSTRVAIESSSLQTDPNRPGVVLLEANLRNSGDYPQAYPQLELTLTDSAERPLVRRVLAPADYLAAAPERLDALLSAGFKPQSDLPLRLWLDVAEIGAAGYRLYLFYP